MSGRVGAVHLAEYEACVRADERDRVLAQANLPAAALAGGAAFFRIEEAIPLAELRRLYVARVLVQTKGNATRAARVLGLNRKTVQRKYRDVIEAVRAMEGNRK